MGIEALACVRLQRPWREPIEVLAPLSDRPWTIGLLSDGSVHGRWSYIVADPAATLTASREHPDPFAAASRLLGAPCPSLEGPPFQGGLVGLACYELGDHVEALSLDRLAGWPDMAVGLYLSVLAFDHQTRCVHVIGRGAEPSAARARAKAAEQWLWAARPVSAPALDAAMSVEPPADYEHAVAQVVSRIHAGEIFQANIARSWTARLAGDLRPFDLLARLHAKSPAPFAGYLNLSDRAVVTNSPERFLTVHRQGEARLAQSRPIKGTRPRRQDPTADEAEAQALLASVKDRAENLMIVDLMRNDLARVCRPGSVKTPELFVLERYANVHHLVSTVSGELKADCQALDLFRAAYPPGSITGAPKVQAMKVIQALEGPRGPYCGSMFWAGLDGALDSNVMIRTAACVRDDDGWRLKISAGAGIVADSDPKEERRETQFKAAALLAALGASAPANA